MYTTQWPKFIFQLHCLHEDLVIIITCEFLHMQLSLDDNFKKFLMNEHYKSIYSGQSSGDGGCGRRSIIAHHFEKEKGTQGSCRGEEEHVKVVSYYQ